MNLLEPFAWSRVAVVDDNDAGATLAEKVLRRAGLREVTRVVDPRDVHDWVAANDPDLVLLDLHMPHLDGYAVLSGLRERWTSTELPVIVLTADATRDASRRALGLGANDFLTKPLETTELVHRVRSMLDMRAAHRALHRRQRWLEAAEQFARDLFAGDVSAPVAAIVTAARRLADADCVWTTPSPPDETVRPGASPRTTFGWGRDDQPIPATGFAIDQTLHDHLERDASPLLLTGETAAGSVTVPDMSAGDFGSAMLIPFQGTEGPRGALCLVRHHDREPFAATDLEGAHQFVTRAALALELMNRRTDRRRYADFFEILVSQVAEYAIVGLDPDGRVTSWNVGAERVEGYMAHEVFGQHFSLFCLDEDVRAGLPDKLLTEARTTGRSRYQGWAVRADASRFWAEISITALHDENEGLVGYAAVTRDMTEARRLEMARESFFAAVSHDIRAPLTAIQGFAEMIPIVEPVRQEEFVDRVHNNVARLGLMVDNMLDHARLRAGALPLTIEPINLKDAVEACVRDLAPVLEGHDVAVDGCLVEVLADRQALGRVLANLLVNAAKYSPRGTSIEVTVETGPLLGQIVVTDHGRGIAEADLTTIFDEFERGSLAEADGGSGLGLSTVQELVTLQQGRVTIASTLGTGTSVTVELPRAV